MTGFTLQRSGVALAIAYHADGEASKDTQRALMFSRAFALFDAATKELGL